MNDVAYKVKNEYRVRFVPQSDVGELVGLYRIARTALSGGDDSPYQRMLWASNAYANANTTVTPTGAYKDLCGLLGR